jgi:hypothetical protein
VKRAIPLFLAFRKWFAESKVWVHRSMSYVSLLNSGMILFLLLSRLEDYGFDLEIKNWFFPIFIGSIFILLFVGYLDDRLGFHREEHRASQKRNPYMKEILDKLNKLESEIKKLK